MPKAENLIGMTFGRWFVLDQFIKQNKNGTRTHSYCLCQCTCEKKIIKEVMYRSLITGMSRSCGCLVIENAKSYAVEMIGKRFGRLLVIEKVEYKVGKSNSIHYKCVCDCGTIKVISGSSLRMGHTVSCGCYSKENMSKIMKEITGENHYGWKGGIRNSNIALYDTYANRLQIFDEIRRDPENLDILQAKCIYCGSWFNPTKSKVNDRIRGIEGKKNSLNNFYCSDGCKLDCPIYNRKKYPRGYKPEVIPNRDKAVQTELREMVLERDDYTCQLCGKQDNLVCHHFEGIKYNPIMSADIDVCITVCQQCSDSIHSQPGCRPFDLQCKSKS